VGLTSTKSLPSDGHIKKRKREVEDMKMKRSEEKQQM